MKTVIRFFSILVLLTSVGVAQADAPLHKALGLSQQQAAEVKDIQARHRKEFAGVRGEFNRERRAFSRAKRDNDTDLMEAQQKKLDTLQQKMVDMKAAEDNEIRALLTPEQSQAFDAYIEKRNAMVGSSRDAKLYAR
ncbi:MAG: Spy/CpxP family protein refolding chaperone [Chromatiales bacterium]|nr:Spy/CpxP family protein refolding chaperone [Chromatiales bacterium]